MGSNKLITAITFKSTIQVVKGSYEVITTHFLQHTIVTKDDLETVQRTDPGIKALWLETCTDSLKGMLHNNLNINAKHEFAGNFFPPRGALPPRDFG